MDCFQVKYLDIDEIIPYKNNPRDNDRAVEAVAASIKEFGFNQPIVVDRNNVIIVGHTRLKASQMLGLKSVPVLKAENLSEEQANAYRLADNKTNELSEWKIEELINELQAIDSINMEDFGFDLEEIVDPKLEEDADSLLDPEKEKEIWVKRGDVFQLGSHRLMCGDSTSKKDTENLVDGKTIDLYITDPPYNVNYTGGTKEKLTIQNDNMSKSDFIDFLSSALKNADFFLKPGGTFYIWYADSSRAELNESMGRAGWNSRQCLIWNKSQLLLGRQDYQWKHEPCLYGWKDGAAHYFKQDRTQTTVMESQAEIERSSKEDLIKYIEELHRLIDGDVLDFPKPAKSIIHPTMKPVELIGKLIHNSSKEGWSVLDNFGGSGSTLIACEQLKRKCYMMELDPKYCQAIIERWEEYTGRKAKKIT